MRQRVFAVLIICLGGSYVGADSPLNTQEINRVEKKIALADQAIKKAIVTFAGELALLKKIKEREGTDEHLPLLNELTSKIKKRFKNPKHQLRWDDFSDSMNIILWGRDSMQNPLGSFKKLIEFSLYDLKQRRNDLNLSARTIYQGSEIRKKSLEKISKINNLINEILQINLYISNYEYELETHEINKLKLTSIICCAIIIAGKIRLFILKNYKAQKQRVNLQNKA